MVDDNSVQIGAMSNPYNVGKAPGSEHGRLMVDDRWLQIKQASHRSVRLRALHSVELAHPLTRLMLFFEAFGFKYA